MSEPTNTQATDSDIAHIKSNIADLNASVKQIAATLTKLAVVEDRQNQQFALSEKTLSRLENVEDRQHAIELRMASTAITSERIAALERTASETASKLQAYEMAGKTAGAGIKGVWAVLGGAITAGVLYLLNLKGGGQ